MSAVGTVLAVFPVRNPAELLGFLFGLLILFLVIDRWKSTRSRAVFAHLKAGGQQSVSEIGAATGFSKLGVKIGLRELKYEGCLEKLDGDQPTYRVTADRRPNPETMAEAARILNKNR